VCEVRLVIFARGWEFEFVFGRLGMFLDSGGERDMRHEIQMGGMTTQ
jgi:hypothetical protein